MRVTQTSSSLMTLCVLSGMFTAQVQPESISNKSPKTQIGSLHWRTTSSINGLRITPDKRQVLAATQAGSIHIFDATNGNEIGQLSAHRGEILSLDLSPNGLWIISGSSDGTLRLWDMRSKTQKILHQEETWYRAVAFAPNGQSFAVGDDEGIVRVWNTLNQKIIAQWDIEQSVRSLSFSDDGSHLVTNHAKGGIGLWNVQKKKEVQHFGTGRMATVQFSPDGKVIAACDYDYLVTLWNAEDGSKIGELKDYPTEPYLRNALTSLCFSPDSKTLVTAGVNDKVYLWSVKERSLQKTLQATSGAGRCITFSVDGQWLLSAGSHQHIHIWNPKTGKSINDTVGHQGIVNSVSLSPDGSSLATACTDGRLRLWGTKTGKLQKTIQVSSTSVSNVTYLDKDRLVTADAQGKLTIWSNTGKKLNQWQAHRRAIHGLALSHDGQRLASCGSDRRIVIWNTSNGKETGRLARPAESGFRSVTFVNGSQQVAAVSPLPMIRVWNVDDGEECLRFETQAGGRDIIATPDGRELLMIGSRSPIRVWEVASESIRRSLPTSNSQSISIALSRDGQVLALGHEDGSIHLWDMLNLNPLARWKGHRGAVASLTFSRNGRRLASGSTDTTALLWDVPTQGKSKVQAVDLKTESLEELWNELANENASQAYKAMRKLMGGPKVTVEFLQKKLTGINTLDVQQLLKDLDHRRFTQREQAFRQLQTLGKSIIKPLEAELRKTKSLEKSRRLKILLTLVEDAHIAPAQLRGIRCVEILEKIGTSEALDCLKSLQKVRKESIIRQEAEQALQRLKDEEK